ncbi:glutamate-rich protein 1 [Channa argus]|uniref:glutamate-rich protein 1 n=1 Tax=Channa argus TaxID=215402 RepID=UPI00352133E6
MAHRKEVFQSKVLQKLYPAVPIQGKEPSPPRTVDALAKKTYVKRNACQENSAGGGAAQTQSAAYPSMRIYTVLPPPAGYMTHSAKDSAEDSVHESDEELNQEKEKEENKRKKRRRKRKPTLSQDSGQDGAAPMCDSTTGQSHAPVVEGGERISRNKKRKLKKKRHKEKLLSMGLMSRASALEFTFQKDEETEEEEEDNERRATEVSDFLRTTLDICMSDSSVHGDKLPFLTRNVDDLLRRISSGYKPNSVLKLLYSLKTFVQQKDTDKLEKALKELYNNSFMSAEETTAVSSLFQYWITDIFPMQEDKTTGLSTTHS